jgi:hypothetical protein
MSCYLLCLMSKGKEGYLAVVLSFDILVKSLVRTKN